jgi:hypothetical protein
VAFAAQEERDDEVDGGSDEIDDGSGDDHDADGGDSTDNDDWDWTKGTDEISVDPNDYSNDTQTKKADEIVAFAAQEELDDEVDDCADEVDDVSSDDHDADGVDSTDGKDSSDADDSSVDDHDADDSDCDDEVDDGSGDDHDAETKRLIAYDKAQDDAFETLARKQIQDKLDSDARIASNVPSAADRILLEKQNTRNRAIYDRAMQGRTERLEFFAASDPFFREREAHNAQATRMLQAREANGEDVRTVRASWEAFNRYGCFGALDDAFFDPRNG